MRDLPSSQLRRTWRLASVFFPPPDVTYLCTYCFAVTVVLRHTQLFLQDADFSQDLEMKGGGRLEMIKHIYRCLN